VNIAGAGAARILAYDDGTTTLTIAGSGTVTVIIKGFSPQFSGSNLTGTVRLVQKNNRANFMQGTVTCYNSGGGCTAGQLKVNVTSSGGSGSAHRWLVQSVPASSTVITYNAAGAALFTVTESTTNTATISGIQFNGDPNGNTGYFISEVYAASGKPILVHDCFFQQKQVSGAIEAIESNTQQGVVWHNSFEGNNTGTNLYTVGGFRTKIDNPQSGQDAWLKTAFWGTLDTTGTNNSYIEDNDFHDFQGAADIDDNARVVWRYNLMDESTMATHGADTSPYGIRYFEYYNNTLVHNAYSDGTTFNLPNGWVGQVRGGTGVYHDNTHQIIGTGSDFPTPLDMVLRIYPLQQSYGAAYPAPAARSCWGAGTTGGADKYAPRQVGLGRVTGNGQAPLGSGVTADSITYVGDLEPLYAWNNDTVATVSIGTFTPNQCTSPDSPTNYIVSGVNYFTNTAKPSYTPYQHPHPLTGSSVATLSVTCPAACASYTFPFPDPPVIPTTTQDSATFTLTNTGTITLTGLNSAAWLSDVIHYQLISNTCGTSLTSGASCTFAVRFKPLTIATFAATLTFTSNDPNSPTVVPISATSVPPTAPAVVIFGGS
jgi:hypothetical protein